MLKITYNCLILGFLVWQELTKAINKKNEETAAGKAEQSGGRLGIVKAPPSADKDSKYGPKRPR